MRDAANCMGVDPDLLLGSVGQTLRKFYSGGVCSGMVMRIGGHAEAPRAEIPLAFQLAMAGVLLAAEFVAEAGAFRVSAASKVLGDGRTSAASKSAAASALSQRPSKKK